MFAVLGPEWSEVDGGYAREVTDPISGVTSGAWLTRQGDVWYLAAKARLTHFYGRCTVGRLDAEAAKAKAERVLTTFMGYRL